MGCGGANGNGTDAVGSPGRVLSIQLVQGQRVTSLLAGAVIESLFSGQLLGFVLFPPNLLSSNSLFGLARAEQQTEKLRGETLVLMERCTLERLHKPHFFGKPG